MAGDLPQGIGSGESVGCAASPGSGYGGCSVPGEAPGMPRVPQLPRVSLMPRDALYPFWLDVTSKGWAAMAAPMGRSARLPGTPADRGDEDPGSGMSAAEAGLAAAGRRERWARVLARPVCPPSGLADKWEARDSCPSQDRRRGPPREDGRSAGTRPWRTIPRPSGCIPDSPRICRLMIVTWVSTGRPAIGPPVTSPGGGSAGWGGWSPSAGGPLERGPLTDAGPVSSPVRCGGGMA